MSRYQIRLLLCAGTALGLILTSALMRSWFTIRVEGLQNVLGVTTVLPDGLDVMRIDLRSIKSCTGQGVCGSYPLNQLRGLYPTLSTGTFWTSLVLAGIVAIQVGSRLIRGAAGAGFTRLGHLAALACFFVTVATAYLFAPETQSAGDVAVLVTRSWAPGMMLGGVLLAMIALYLSVVPERSDFEAPVVIPRVPVATARLPVTPAPNAAAGARALGTGRIPATPPSQKLPVAAPEEARKRAPSSVPFDRSSSPELTLEAGPAEHALHGKLNYVAATVDLSRAGIDARREDGVAKLVIWTDVVGIVARRLPPEAPYNGDTFVDLISSAGSTLRFVPWTRWSGDTLPGDPEVPEAVARAIIQLVATHCPDAQLDPATRTFLGGQGDAAQLPDIATLAQHDDRLA